MEVGLTQHLAETGQFLRGEIALTLALFVALHQVGRLAASVALNILEQTGLAMTSLRARVPWNMAIRSSSRTPSATNFIMSFPYETSPLSAAY